MVVVDTLFYTAIGPLVPLLARTYGLSKAEIGTMSGPFGLGAIARSVLSAYLVGRIEVRPVAVAGLLASPRRAWRSAWGAASGPSRSRG